MTDATKAKQTAKLLQRLEEFFDGESGYDKTIDRVKAIESAVEELQGVDHAKAAEEFEKLKASVEKLSGAIRRSRKGFWEPGMEDEADNFSLVRAMRGIKTSNWKGAENEQEIIRAATEKAQNVGDFEAGGAFIPDQVIPDVIAAIYTRSVFISLAGEGTTRVSTLDGLTGGQVTIPKFKGGLIAYWIGEEDEYAESQTKVGDVVLRPHKLGVLVKLTDSMKKMAGYGFESLLRNDMVRAAAKKLDYTIAWGNGGNHSPKGIMHHTGIKIYDPETDSVLTYAQALAASLDGVPVTFDHLASMKLGLEEDDIDLDDTSAWISAPRTWDYLKKLKIENYSAQSAGNPYLLGMPMISNERLRDLVGDFDGTTQFASNAEPGGGLFPQDDTVTKHSTIIGGNLGEVVLGRWAGIEVESDAGKGKGFTSDHEYLKLRMRCDVGIREERALIAGTNFQVRT